MLLVFLSLGSNIDPETNIRKAVAALGREMRVVAISTVWRTEAIGGAGQPPFYNAVIEVETELPPRQLKFDVLRRIEAELGRVRCADKYAPRPIDLDVIVYGDLVVDEPELVIPDPDIYTRRFLAQGLAELSPSLVLAGSGKPILAVLEQTAATAIEPLFDYTASITYDIQEGGRENVHNRP